MCLKWLDKNVNHSSYLELSLRLESSQQFQEADRTSPSWEKISSRYKPRQGLLSLNSPKDF
jgi:hypothetical protein